MSVDKSSEAARTSIFRSSSTDGLQQDVTNALSAPPEFELAQTTTRSRNSETMQFPHSESHLGSWPSFFAVGFTVLAILAVASRGLAESRIWAIPTEQDNDTLYHMNFSTQEALVVRAGEHVYVIGYNNGEWSRLAILNAPDTNGYFRGIEGTDLIVTWNSQPSNVTVYRLGQATNGWAWNLHATIRAPTNATWLWPVHVPNADESLWQDDRSRLYYLSHESPPSLITTYASETLVSAALSPVGIQVLIYKPISDSTRVLSSRLFDRNGLPISSVETNVPYSSWYYRLFVDNDHEGFWLISENGSRLQHFRMSSLTVNRTIVLTNRSASYAHLSAADDGNVLFSADAGDHRVVLKFDAQDRIVFEQNTVLPDVDGLSPDGRFASAGSNPTGLLNAQTGQTMHRDVFGVWPEPATDLKFIKTHDGETFLAKASFWWDGIRIARIDQRAPWEEPSSWPLMIVPRIVDFGTVPVSMSATQIITLQNRSWSNSVIALEESLNTSLPECPFVFPRTSTVGDSETNHSTLIFRPTRPGRYFANLRLEIPVSTWAGGYSYRKYVYNEILLVGTTVETDGGSFDYSPVQISGIQRETNGSTRLQISSETSVVDLFSVQAAPQVHGSFLNVSPARAEKLYFRMYEATLPPTIEQQQFFRLKLGQ